MPIQFTCPHCGQLLSTARRKVGQVVKCVSCSGSVIVPPPLSEQLSDHQTLDGPHTTVQPNEPQFDSSSLPNESAVHSGGFARTDNSNAAYDDLSLPNANQGHTGPYSVWGSEVSVSRGTLYAVGALLIGCTLLSFALGWAMGRESSIASTNVLSNVKQTVYGRLNYVNGKRTVSGDSEAVVIALPVGRKPDEKIPIESLRPNAPPPGSQDLGVLSIRTIGGDFARTGRNGDFELQLPQAGEYFVLLISAHAARPASRPATTTEVVELGNYFKNADQLLGENAFLWSKQLVRTNKKIDFLFPEMTD